MSGILISGQKKPAVRLDLSTRKQNSIENAMDANAVDPEIITRSEALKRKYESPTIHRDTKPCYTYNCHGLTFGARRTQIWKPEEVQKIIDDDGYKPIRPTDVEIGDIVIYRNRENGDIEHSGIVVKKNTTMPANPMILGKWGEAHEVIHFAGTSEYTDKAIEYYRLFA